MKGLVLDGGGGLGIGQANILDKCSLDKFDFFAGTSIGAAIAIRAALDLPTNTLTDFFHEEMPKIFAGHDYRKYIFWKAKYSDKALNAALQALLPGCFGDAKKPVFITALALGTKRLKVFNSLNPDDASLPAWEVARAAVAAETYFSPWRGYSDGGVVANNPSMVATAAARSVLGIEVDDLEICSIGTGIAAKSSDTPTKSWGSVRWGVWLLSALLGGASSSMHEYFVRSLLLKKYERIQFIRDADWSMDNPNSMLAAEAAWKPEVTTAIQTVNAF